MTDAQKTAFYRAQRIKAEETNDKPMVKKIHDKLERPARQQKFYRTQRNDAQETGDQPTVNKIYGKLGRPAPNVDANTVDKDILGTVGGAVAAPLMAAAAPEAAAAGGVAGAAGGAGALAARMGAGGVAGGAMRGMAQAGPKIVGASLHPIDHALAVLEQKLPGVTEKIEQAIGEHHESLGGSSPFRTYTQKALPKPTKSVTGRDLAPAPARKVAKNPKEQGMQDDIDYIRNKQANNARRASSTAKKESSAPAAGRKGSQSSATPKQKGQASAPKEQQVPTTGVKSGHVPKVGAKQAKPGPATGKTAAAPKKAPARTSAAAKANPYSKEGIAKARGTVPKNNVVKRKKDA
jgi:hypothetical protein